MKFLTTLLAFNFLCVWCFGFQDCDDDDVIICSEADTSPFSELTLASIPYRNGSVLAFSSTTGTDFSTVTTREELLRLDQAGNCERRLDFTLQSTDDFNLINVRGHLRGDSSAYRYVIIRGSVGEAITVDVGIDQSPDSSGDFLIRQEGQRVVADTTLFDDMYQNVLVSTFPLSEAFVAVYYTQEEGFVQFDLLRGPRIFLAD